MDRTLDHMTRRRLAPVLTLACAAALAAGLSACAPEGTSPTPTATGPVSPSPSTTTSPTPSEDPSADACLVGDWTMDQAGLERFYADINGLMDGAGVVFTPQGSAALTLAADGAFSWAPRAEVTAEVSGTTILISFGGHTDGTYTATADRISTDTQSTDGLVVTATIDGAPTDAGAVADQIAGAPVTDASYTCTADTLTLVTEVAGGTATSVLHR